jgi:alkaline phosphatase
MTFALRPAPGRRFALICALLVVLGGCAVRSPADGAVAARPKNIIILFADGVAPVQWEFGRYTSRALRKTSFATTDVVFREGVLGLMSTASSDSMVTDSAAGGSAMSTGFKVNNGAISMTPDGMPRRTVMQAARAAGKRIGLLTTAEIHDASPAAFSVNAKDRRDGQSIVDQYFAMEPDVLIGGGRDFFLPRGTPGGKRTDGRDMIAGFAQKGYRIARTPAELQNPAAGRVLGLFADEDMGFELDRDAAQEPVIADMARAALAALSRDNPNGFVLLVENENTDTAGHHNDVAALMRALWAFDDAVKVALEFQKQAPDETLILVTGDHETGGLSVTYAQRDLSGPGAQQRIYPAQKELEMIERITLSLAELDRKLGREPKGEDLDRLVAQHFPGFRIDADLREAVLKRAPLERNLVGYGPTRAALSRMVSRQTGFYWGTTGHTTEPVAVGALGPGAQLFRGYQDNTDFARHVHALIGAAP